MERIEVLRSIIASKKTGVVHEKVVGHPDFALELADLEMEYSELKDTQHGEYNDALAESKSADAEERNAAGRADAVKAIAEFKTLEAINEARLEIREQLEKLRERYNTLARGRAFLLSEAKVKAAKDELSPEERSFIEARERGEL